MFVCDVVLADDVDDEVAVKVKVGADDVVEAVVDEVGLVRDMSTLRRRSMTS